MKPKKTYPFKPDWTIAPGELVKEHAEALGFNQSALADRLGYTRAHISKLILGNSALTADMAVALQRVLGAPAEYWMKLETTHRLFLARKKAKKR